MSEDPFQKVVRLVSEGLSVVQACKQDGTPGRTAFYKWLQEDPENANNYARAMDLRADQVFDEILDIADNATNDWMERKGEEGSGWVLNGEHVQRSRLRIDARKWALARMNPKKYGDKLEFGGAISHNVTVKDSFKDDDQKT